jgi:hypothetical protein
MQRTKDVALEEGVMKERIDTQHEQIPSRWDNDHDEHFFRITAQLFSSEFTYAASVLLASYDDEAVDATYFAAIVAHDPTAIKSRDIPTPAMPTA